MNRRAARATVSALLAIGASSILAGQADWPSYNRDEASTRFSPLKQIDTTNVQSLVPAWTYHTQPPPSLPSAAASAAQAQPPASDAPPVTPPPQGGRGGRGLGTGPRASEATPIVVKNVMYLPTPYGRVVALQADTGKELWSYAAPNAQVTLRGVEYWPGDRSAKPRILFSSGDRLISLDAVTGEPVSSFGENGSISLRQGIDNGFANGQLSLSSPPRVYRNLVITGARVQESPALGYAGDTRAWDLHTGKLVWQFHSIPQPGEPGADTWTDEGRRNRSGTNVWGFMSLDAALGIVYLPYASPSYDFYGGDRRGANLFGNSIVALDAMTGKLKWHFQAIHHDTWDYDFSAAPMLFDIVRAGRRIPVLAEVSKQGLVYILDRRDGKPIFGMEERPVPQSDVPGEAGWPTQPFPVKPAPVARQSFTPTEIAKVTPAHEKVCTDMLATEGGMHNDGPFTRYGTTLSIVFPGTLGASNWHGASVDPTLGYLFMNVIHLADVGKMVKAPEGSPLAYTRTSPWGGFARFWNGEKYWPCQAPPWGEMLAIDANTGDVAWKVPLGVVEELDAIGVHNTGAMNMGGSIATAGGLVFIAATNDRRMRAFDSRTGKVLWETKLPAGGYATPSTYQGADGRQYVAIVAAGGGYYDRVAGDSVVAFALPASARLRQ